MLSHAKPTATTQAAVVGSLLGTAVGDAIGLPYEGLSRRRAFRLLGEPTMYRLLPGWGMVSDDTEHACMVVQSLIASGDDVELFSRELAHRLCEWPRSVAWMERLAGQLHEAHTTGTPTKPIHLPAWGVLLGNLSSPQSCWPTGCGD